MGFNGYLIKLGGSGGTMLPWKFMKYDAYSSTPDQRMETEAGRATTGLLHRTTVEHTSTKIEFETPPMTNIDVAEFNQLLKSNFTNARERKLTIEYYNEESDGYETAEVYVPDIQYKIERIDLAANIIHYQSFRVAFIEY